MFRFTLLALLTLSVCFCRGQSTSLDTAFTKRPARGSGLDKIVQTYRPIYNFQKGEVIASIGAGAGFNEIVYSLMADSLTFYLQDIDLSGLAIPDLEPKVVQIYRNAGRTSCNATFLTYKGTETSTNLPDRLIDKIIVEHSLHEFTHPSEMLQSIRANLKLDGVLYIRELITKRPHRKHPVCQKELFTEQALVTLLHKNGFQLVNKLPVNSADGVVFQFKK